VIIGENRMFDHIFATYQPKQGESISNLLSKSIIDKDGNPGPNYWLATQLNAKDTHADKYQPSPQSKSLYPYLLAPLAGGPTDVCKDNGICTLADAQSSENGLAQEYYQYMLTGGTGLPSKTPDTRISGVLSAPPYSSMPAGHSSLRTPTHFRTIRMLQARYIVSIKCGSRYTATLPMERCGIRKVAAMTSSLM
jgi:hypothetical protein